jgi:hypothetical protein
VTHVLGVTCVTHVSGVTRHKYIFHVSLVIKCVIGGSLVTNFNTVREDQKELARPTPMADSYDLVRRQKPSCKGLSPLAFFASVRYPIRHAQKGRWIRYSICDCACINYTAAFDSLAVIVQTGLPNMQMNAITYAIARGKAVGPSQMK